jgi:hypothetical protein
MLANYRGKLSNVCKEIEAQVLGIAPQLAVFSKACGHQSVQFYWPIFTAVGAASLVVNRLLGGLSYLLYDGLTTTEEST